MVAASLVSTQNRVEAPFIIVQVGNYTFGNCSKLVNKQEAASVFKITYPNYLSSINITKINGSVNTYQIKFDYGITEFDDPNLLEKVFSSVSSTRKIIISYGDWNAPAFIYKEEEAIITKIQTQVDFSASKITYTVSCTSTALSMKSGTFSFNSKIAKPSDEIIKLLTNKSYGLSNIFTGMRGINATNASKFIARDDKKVQLEARAGVSLFEYISYLVSCMVSNTDKGGAIKDARYFWAIYDDISNEYGGSYFKVVRVSVNAKYNLSYNTYEVDVGYPGNTLVTQFNINNDESWSLLYNYSKDVQLPEYRYSIDDNGNMLTTYSPSVTSSSTLLKTTEVDRNWWTQMTQFPIKATLTIKGLLRPALLMSYVKVNCFFYGHKHTSSGLYIITKQQDTIDSTGYRTTLTLTRVSGDEFYV